MRLVTWNCRVGGFRRKAQYVAPLRPDVLVVQEIEAIDAELFLDGDCQPTFHDRCANTGRRGIGVFSYTDAKLTCIDDADSFAGFGRYLAHGPQALNVAAVWTFATKRRDTHYRQAQHGLTRYSEWVRGQPTVLLGDLNANASFQGTVWRDFQKVTESLGLVSAYHSYFGEQFGAETRPTYHHRANDAAPFHIDYCFVPAALASRITRVEIGSFDAWQKLSDHVPLIVDIDLSDYQVIRSAQGGAA